MTESKSLWDSLTSNYFIGGIHQKCTVPFPLMIGFIVTCLMILVFETSGVRHRRTLKARAARGYESIEDKGGRERVELEWR